MNILKYLRQPFPKGENKWKTMIWISLFVFIFLTVFQPFGISSVSNSHSKYIFLGGYGMVTLIILFINLILIEKIFHRFFNERNWTIGKDIIWLLWIIFSIGLGNAFYTAFISEQPGPDFRTIIAFQAVTLAVAAIPVILLITTKQKYLLKKHCDSANDVNKKIAKEKTGNMPEKIIHFYAENEKNAIKFSINDLYFIESSGNYIDLYILYNGKISRKTFRSTLKGALHFFTDCPEIIQCHRSFIVNTSKIKNANGNSQGLRLSLENCENEIPVSRKFVNIIKNKIG